MTLSENIRLYRKKKGLTQVQLGELIGVSGATVTRYEKDQLNPGITNINKIAAALNVSAVDLLGYGSNESTSIVTGTYYLEKKLEQIGYGIDGIEDEGYLWIKYPDGTLEVTDEELTELDESCAAYLRFKLEELKQKRIKDFKPKQ